MTLTEIKTAALENVIRIHGNADDRKQTEVIDVNIKTNLTLSNSKRSKFVQKSLFVFVLFFTGTFTILIFNLRKELQALKSQEQCVETKIDILMRKYEKVNNQLSRFRSHMNYHKYYQPLTTSDKSEGDSVISGLNYKEETVLRDEKLNIGGSVTSRDDRADGILGREDKPSLISVSDSRGNISSIVKDRSRDTAASDKDSTINFIDDNKSKNGNRFARTILNDTDENRQAVVQSVKLNSTYAGLNLSSSNDSNYTANGVENGDNISRWNEPRTARMRRNDERRGKIRTKNKRRPNRSRRRLGPLVATFIGGIPEQHITDGGTIGPWVKLNKNTSHYELQKFHLVDNKKAIEVTMNGLYMISAQIFYIGQQSKFSYWILLSSEGQSQTQRLTKCSAVSSPAANEVSCHTNVVLPLRRGDRVHLQQQERNRLINLREGLSYLQLVLLSDESQRRQHVL